MFTSQRVALYQVSVVNAYVTDLPLRPSVGLCVGLSVCPKVYCGKTAEWIRIPLEMVSAVGRGMGVLDEGGDRRRRRAVMG